VKECKGVIRKLVTKKECEVVKWSKQSEKLRINSNNPDIRDHCDYTFATLQENLPKALGSVAVETIRKWEHRMWCWMDAYDGGMGAWEAQRHVQKFSSRKYKSHQRVPEGLSVQLDI
jgi:hypothetical protein